MSLRRWPLTRRALARLRTHASPGRPVRFRSRAKVIVDGDDCYGACHLTAVGFTIEVESSLSDDLAREVLTHEWTHAMTASDPLAAKHKGSFGPVWAKVYRVVIGEEG